MAYTKNHTRKRSAKPGRSAYEVVNELVLTRLEEGTPPWRMPWTAPGLPMRMNAGKPYRGINVFLLGMSAMASGYSSPWWGTYDHIAERAGMKKIPDSSNRGYHWESKDGKPAGVRKGEKATMVTYWSTWNRTEQNADGKDEVHKGQMLLRTSAFNAEQADGLPERFAAQDNEPGAELDPIESAEALIRRYLDNGGPQWEIGGSRACYSPSADLARVPPLSAYTDPHEYYSTGFHELGHSTGHPSRLDREVGECLFGSPDYGREELVAELTCCYLCAVAGVNTPEVTGNSAAYLAGWIRALKGDVKLVVMAAAKAQKAADLIQGIEFADVAELEPAAESTGADAARLTVAA